jgi:hypothetical protein
VHKADGTQGIVPVAYVEVEEDEDEGDAFSLAGGRTASMAPSTATGGPGGPDGADYNSLLRGCVCVCRAWHCVLAVV